MSEEQNSSSAAKQEDPEWQRIKRQVMGGVGVAGGVGSVGGLLVHGTTGMGVVAIIAGGLLYCMGKEQPRAYAWMGDKAPWLREGRVLARFMHKRRAHAATAVVGAEVAPHVDRFDGGAQPVGNAEAGTLGLPDKCLFSQLLDTGWRPSLEEIFLGFLPGGTPVFVEAKDLCHIAISGPTGNGKSSLIRLIEAQLCYAGADVLHMDPDWTGYDVEQGEDWTPFIPKYVYDPFECKKYDVIEFFLKQIALEKIPHRRELRAQSKPTGKKYFVSMDELPAIMKAVPHAQEYLEAILRDGRKHGIHLISSSQDFLVSTLFPNGGGEVRECYRTAFCIGGNNASSRTLLDVSSKEMPEDQLGQGVVMLRCKAIPKAKLVRVPYLDNRSLYLLLGPSTYTPSATKVPTDVLGLPPGNARQVQPEPEYRPSQQVRMGAKRQELSRAYHVKRARRFYPAQQQQEAEPGELHVAPIDGELERGIRAFKAGFRSLDLFAAQMDMKRSEARDLWSRVRVVVSGNTHT